MNSNSKINKEEKYPLQNTTLHGLELGINKLERELNKEFDLNKSITLRKLIEEVEKRGCVIFKVEVSYHVNKKLEKL